MQINSTKNQGDDPGKHILSTSFLELYHGHIFKTVEKSRSVITSLIVRGWKRQDWKTSDQFVGVEDAGRENAGQSSMVEKAGLKKFGTKFRRGGKSRRTTVYGTLN